MVDFKPRHDVPTADLADAERMMATAAACGGVLAGFGLDPSEALATVEAAGEQMRTALERLAAGE